MDYAGQEISLTSTDTGFVNDRQKVSITAEKALETSSSFGIGLNGEITGVSFGLYAKENIPAEDGSVLPADGLIEIAFADENGHIQFNSDLPFGKYYAKELSCDPYYVKNESLYDLSFDYAGQDKAVVEISLNNGEAIVNELLLGIIQGSKVDTEDATLANAEFGLFSKDTKEFTSENALLTTTSDDSGKFAFVEVGRKSSKCNRKPAKFSGGFPAKTFPRTIVDQILNSQNYFI